MAAKKVITAENQKAAGKEYEQEEYNGNKIFFGTEEMMFQGKLPKEDFYSLYAVQLGKMLEKCSVNIKIRATINVDEGMPVW